MKFLPLLFANLKRKKVRTTLTIGSFVVAMFLFGLLGAIRYGFRQGIDVAGADRLVVIGRTSMIQPLPLPYKERLKGIPGVKQVCFAVWFGGVYQDSTCRRITWLASAMLKTTTHSSPYASAPSPCRTPSRPSKRESTG